MGSTDCGKPRALRGGSRASSLRCGADGSRRRGIAIRAGCAPAARSAGRGGGVLWARASRAARSGCERRPRARGGCIFTGCWWANFTTGIRAACVRPATGVRRREREGASRIRDFCSVPASPRLRRLACVASPAARLLRHCAKTAEPLRKPSVLMDPWNPEKCQRCPRSKVSAMCPALATRPPYPMHTARALNARCRRVVGATFSPRQLHRREDDLREAARVEARSADERSVNVRLRH